MKPTPQTAGDWQNLDTDNQAPHYLAIAREVNPRDSVLDIGCGSGVLAKHLPASVRYTGIDLSQYAVDASTLADIHCVSAESFEPPDQYDRIIFNEMLYYCVDPVALLNKYRRYLKPGGAFIVSIFRRDESISFKACISSILSPSKPTSNSHCLFIVRRFLDSTDWNVRESVASSTDGNMRWGIIVAMP